MSSTSSLSVDNSALAEEHSYSMNSPRMLYPAQLKSHNPRPRNKVTVEVETNPRHGLQESDLRYRACSSSGSLALHSQGSEKVIFKGPNISLPLATQLTLLALYIIFILCVLY